MVGWAAVKLPSLPRRGHSSVAEIVVVPPEGRRSGYYLMLRTKLAKLVVHGFEADSVKRGFEAKMADAALELERFDFAVSQHGS